MIDTGINPYHEFFHASGPLYKHTEPDSVTPAVLREFGIDPDHIIPVTRTGNFRVDFAKDKKVFARIKKGEPYWFEGTNVIGISFNEGGGHLRPDGSASSHGVATAGAVLAAHPEAIVVAVEGMGVPEAERWAFTHPAVDLVSTSYGPAVGAPWPLHVEASYEGVVKNGKVHFGASSNDPGLASTDGTAGPWWTIGISGFEEGSSGGRQHLSGTFPDFVGDFSQDLPNCRSCEEGLSESSGTSFATPRSAGIFSKILLTARRARAPSRRDRWSGGPQSQTRVGSPHTDQLEDAPCARGGRLLPGIGGLQLALRDR